MNVKTLIVSFVFLASIFEQAAFSQARADIPCSYSYGRYFCSNNTQRLISGEGELISILPSGKVVRSTIDEHSITGLFFPSDAVGWAVGQNGNVFLSEDAGKTWKKKLKKYPSALREIFCTDNDTCYVVGDRGVILKTANRGRKWEPMSSGTTRDLTAVHFVNPMVGWVGGDGGTVLKTTTGGLTWDPPQYLEGYKAPILEFLRNIRDIHFVNENVGWLAVPDGIFRTENGGDSWNFVEISLSLIAVVSGDGINVTAIDRRGPSKAVSADGGKTWKVDCPGCE